MIEKQASHDIAYIFKREETKIKANQYICIEGKKKLKTV